MQNISQQTAQHSTADIFVFRHTCLCSLASAIVLQATVFLNHRGLGPALQSKRALLEQRVKAIGFGVLPSQGTYFLVADISKFLAQGEDDVAFCKRLTIEAGVTLIPVSAFYVSEKRPHHLVRFCFCKDNAKLFAACEKLEAYFAGQL